MYYLKLPIIFHTSYNKISSPAIFIEESFSVLWKTIPKYMWKIAVQHEGPSITFTKNTEIKIII